jgi:MFS family permease
VAKLILTSALISFGAGFVIPLFNVFFHQGLHAPEHRIGFTVGAGNAFLAAGALLVPLLTERLGKIQTVVVTRMLSIPFIFLIAFSGDLASNLARPSRSPASGTWPASC